MNSCNMYSRPLSALSTKHSKTDSMNAPLRQLFWQIVWQPSILLWNPRYKFDRLFLLRMEREGFHFSRADTAMRIEEIPFPCSLSAFQCKKVYVTALQKLPDSLLVHINNRITKKYQYSPVSIHWPLLCNMPDPFSNWRIKALDMHLYRFLLIYREWYSINHWNISLTIFCLRSSVTIILFSCTYI